MGTGSWASYQQVLADPRWLAQRPLFQRLAALPQVRRDAQLQHAALHLIGRDPGVYARHLVDNLSRMTIGGPYTFQSTGAGRYLLYGVPDLALLLASDGGHRLARRAPAARGCPGSSSSWAGLRS